MSNVCIGDKISIECIFWSLLYTSRYCLKVSTY